MGTLFYMLLIKIVVNRFTIVNTTILILYLPLFIDVILIFPPPPILTKDGVINDINRTLRRLIAISHLPLSVVFIGVGPADFTLMVRVSNINESCFYSKVLFVLFTEEHAWLALVTYMNDCCVVK